MNKEQEKEQLMQDASTLLMFANVARQGLGLPATSPKEQAKSSPSQDGTPQGTSSQAHSQRSSVSTTYKKSPAQTSAESPRLAQHLPRQNPLNQPQRSPNLQATNSPPQLRHGSWNTPAGSSQPHMPVSGGLPPALSRGFVPYGYPAGSSINTQSALQTPPPQQYPPPGSTQLAYEPNIPPIASMYPAYSQFQHQLGVPAQGIKKETSEDTKPEAASQTPQSNLPAKGSFLTHHRTPSGDHLGAKGSPRANQVALSKGINVETGKRSTDNAVIAAAALAAAADIPLPLRRSETEKKEPMPSTGSDQKEESVMTEPEDDNRTDDETIPQNTPMTGAIAAFPSAVPKPVSDRPFTPPTGAEGFSAPLTLNHDQTKPVNGAEPEKEPEMAKSSPSEKANELEPTDKAYRPPPLHLYKVDPDSGIIGCICGIEEDDGFTIQCDICFRWQHCSCMGYRTNDEVPEDEYKCYYCDEKKWNKFNPITCREDTLARLEMEKESESNAKTLPGKRKGSGSNGEDRKKRKTEKDMKPINTGPAETRPGNNKRKSSTNLAATNVIPPSPGVLEVPLKNNELLEDGVTAETYQSIYFKLKDYDFKTPAVRKKLESLGSRFETSANRSLAIEIMPQALYRSTKFSKVILPIHQKYLQEKNEVRKTKGYGKTSVQVKPYSDNPKHKFTGINKFGLYITDNSATPGVDTTIPAGSTVIEYLGEIDFLELYKANPANQYSVWGTVKPKVSIVSMKLFDDEPPVELVIDARFVGNESRFIRKSCPAAANCRIMPIYVPQLKAFKFLVVTSKPITLKGDAMEEELRIAWEWDELHPIRQLLPTSEAVDPKEVKKFEDFDEDNKFLLISCVEAILNFTDCGCNTASASQCAIFKIKKATSYLLRSTRKASGLSTASSSKSKEYLVFPPKTKEFISWKERLVERDGKLHSAILSLNPSEESSSVSSEDDESENRATSVGPQADQADQSEISIRDKSSFFRVPFRQQLLSRTQILAGSKRSAEETQDAIKGEVQSSEPRTVAIPIMPEILSLIRDTVNATLKPLQDAVAGSNPEIKEVRRDSVPKKEIDKGPAEVVVPLPSEQKETIVKAPTVVKKLSFADYKKKMK